MISKLARGSLAALSAALLLAGCGPSYPDCDTDDDCNEGEFCVNGQCQLCRTADDCGPGQDCNGGRCEEAEGYCEGDGDCGDGQGCQNNRCVTTMTPVELPPQEDPNAGAGAEGPCTLSPVYFGFDLSDLDTRARDAIQENARCIRERGIEGVHLTGHTDDRGTEAYNLALGDRRARQVQRYLTSLGVSPSAITMSSVGEEWSTGTDDAGWARDRKVEISER